MEKVGDVHQTCKVIERGSSSDARQIDKDGGIKNKWLWSWIAEKDANGDFLSDYFRKIDVPGKAFCIYCRCIFGYKGGGKRDLLRHAQNSKDHKKNKKLYLQNTIIPSSWTGARKSMTCGRRDVCNTPYGAAQNIHDSTVFCDPKTSISTYC